MAQLTELEQKIISIWEKNPRQTLLEAIVEISENLGDFDEFVDFVEKVEFSDGFKRELEKNGLELNLIKKEESEPEVEDLGLL